MMFQAATPIESITMCIGRRGEKLGGVGKGRRQVAGCSETQ